jgi:hypothetical protein
VGASDGAAASPPRTQQQQQQQKIARRPRTSVDIPHEDLARAVAGGQAAGHRGAPRQRVALGGVAAQRLDGAAAHVRGRGASAGAGRRRRRALAARRVQRAQLRAHVKEVHLARFRPRRDDVRQLRHDAQAVDGAHVPHALHGELGRRAAAGAAVVVVVVFGAAARRRLRLVQRRKTHDVDRVGASRVRLRARDHRQRQRERRAARAQAVGHDVK